MNPETKKALHNQLGSINVLIKQLSDGLVKAEEDFKLAKEKRDDIKKQIDSLQKDRQKIKEDLNERVEV